MLGLCDPSNFLLFEYSFYPPRRDALFSNYSTLRTCSSCFDNQYALGYPHKRRHCHCFLRGFQNSAAIASLKTPLLVAKQVVMVWACAAKEDNDWVKKCMEYEMEGAKPRRRPKKTWRDIVQKDCQECKLNREDTMDCNRWRKQIRDD